MMKKSVVLIAICVVAGCTPVQKMNRSPSLMIPKIVHNLTLSSPSDIFGVQGSADAVYSVADGAVRVKVQRMRIYCSGKHCIKKRQLTTARIGIAANTGRESWRVVKFFDTFPINHEAGPNIDFLVPIEGAFYMPYESARTLREQRLVIEISQTFSDGTYATFNLLSPRGTFHEAIVEE